MKNQQRRRKTFEELSVITWMYPGETYNDAKHRLSREWRDGIHPVQRREADKASPSE